MISSFCVSGAYLLIGENRLTAPFSLFRLVIFELIYSAFCYLREGLFYQKALTILNHIYISLRVDHFDPHYVVCLSCCSWTQEFIWLSFIPDYRVTRP